jgi:purine-nucleoside/S-methyl-5'-thioadenosine phosphorylase / adenosine deaminase
MIYHTEGLFQIAFGDARTSFDLRNFKKQYNNDLLQYKPFNQLKKSMSINQLIFLHQVHGNHGLSVTSLDQAVHLRPFYFDGDFLITTVSEIGLAIATADCLPIILYNPVNQLIGIAHAGWRGSMAHIATQMLEHMIVMGSNAQHMRVFFGPSARRCCYAVGPEVLSALDSFYFKDSVIQSRKSSVFFDLPHFNRLQLQEAGIPKSAFNLAYNHCTICDPSLCSYRRDRNSDRQMTVVALR